MNNDWKDRLSTIGAKILVGILALFTIWLLVTILFDPGPGPCLGLGGC